MNYSRPILIVGQIFIWLLLISIKTDASEVSVYGIHEVIFSGPTFGPKDNPVSMVEFYTEWQHQDGGPIYRIYGFWDGDGKGNATGSVFKVRFCPTRQGNWRLINTHSNVKELNNQKEGYSISVIPSDHPGFWEVDQEDIKGRWYKRSDGSHPYIIGNTMYSFLSEMKPDGPNDSNIKKDIQGNAKYFKKVRFSIMGDRYPHPKDKPFLDHNGKPTDNGNFSFRPNPGWFTNRVDLAVKSAYELDLIADLILNGPDTEDSRSALVSAENGGDCTPYLKYIAARYGSYPNIWICMANEWDIKKPKFTAEEIKILGYRINAFLPYPTPLSIHAATADWNRELNTLKSWNDHIILQYKIKKMQIAANFLEKNYLIGGENKPVIDDELAYQGRGDQWEEPDVIEAHLGAFFGGGYGTTGFKDPITKQGHYFFGAFNPEEHTAADNLKWMRDIIDQNITFWRMKPRVQINFGGGRQSLSIFRNVHENFRVLEWANNEYLLATNQAHQGIEARLPRGTWQIRQFDIIDKIEKLLSADATKSFKFNAPDSRAVIFQVKKIGE